MIGRWNVVDAYAEHPDQINMSPYVYVADNPVDKTDPDGNCPPCDLQGQPSSQQSGQCSSCNLPGTSSGVQVTPTPSEIPKLTLTNLQEAADKVSDVSTDVELAGVGTSLSGAPEVGVPLTVGAAAEGTVADVVSTAIDFGKGDFYKGAVKTIALVIDAGAGHLIKTSATRETTKLVLDAVKTVAGKVVDKAINTLPSNTHEKLSTTMQRSSIPKPVVPPPPIIKKTNQ